MRADHLITSLVADSVKPIATKKEAKSKRDKPITDFTIVHFCMRKNSGIRKNKLILKRIFKFSISAWGLDLDSLRQETNLAANYNKNRDFEKNVDVSGAYNRIDGRCSFKFHQSIRRCKLLLQSIYSPTQTPLKNHRNGISASRSQP